MADAELEEIRRARLAQLQQQQGGQRGGPSQEAGQEDQRRQAEYSSLCCGLPQYNLRLHYDPNNELTPTVITADRRAAIMNQILDPAAADRLGRIRLVKESRAVDIEQRLMMLAQTGQIRQKVTEEQLKELLNAVAENQRKEEEEHKIVISRRKGGWDDDDDLLDL
ncbi:DNA-binding protein [Penicillium daleae]|uniref:DNA-binding protein n=1 Tax=Penicillium daleae TaxID=63821 RepID=A0AAD6G6F0_9EURO|nr:DNA-binding protein [Penicillium daleae]KAJ5460132.1 DNA-binding protein [Penicillium daleae]